MSTIDGDTLFRGAILVFGETGLTPRQLVEQRAELLALVVAAREELRLIRMKDGAGPYDPTLKSRMDIAIARATGERA